MNEDAIFPVLTSLPLLSNVDAAAREHIARVLLDVSELSTFSEGEVLMREGDLGWITGFVLVRGSVSVERGGSPAITVAAPSILGEMQQFNPRSQRTATVTALGPVEVLRFAWQHLYQRVSEVLDAGVQTQLRTAMERLVVDRFEHDTVMDIPLFRGLSAPLQVRTCLLLLWLARPVAYASGETIVEKDQMCSETGYLITHGGVRVKRDHEPAIEYRAPELFGIFASADPAAKWTAAITANGETEVLRFDWATYRAALKASLAAEDFDTFTAAVAALSRDHFVH